MIFEVTSAALIIIIATLFLNFSSLTMPSTLFSMLVVLFSLSWITFSALVWREKPADERESLHALMAGRVAFLAGVAVLVVGVVTQSLMHNIDPWLIITLCVMVTVKIALLIYSRHKM